MRIKELLNNIDIDRREAESLLGFVLKKDRVWVMAHQEVKVDTRMERRFTKLIERRKSGEPIAYIVGFQPFLGHEFKVNRSTLIPRPETEQLAEQAIECVKKFQADGDGIMVCDIGTGSGCIAISIALACPKAKVFASDISPAALSVVKYNAKNFSTRIKVIHSNLLDSRLAKQINYSRLATHDSRLIIVANLPYLPYSDKRAMQRDVVKFEPASALFAAQNGQALIKKLLMQIKDFIINFSGQWTANNQTHTQLTKSKSQISNRKSYLNKKLTSQNCVQRGDSRITIFLEIDPRQAKSLATFSHKLFPDKEVKIKKDMFKRERFLAIK